MDTVEFEIARRDKIGRCSIFNVSPGTGAENSGRAPAAQDDLPLVWRQLSVVGAGANVEDIVVLDHGGLCGRLCHFDYDDQSTIGGDMRNPHGNVADQLV